MSTFAQQLVLQPVLDRGRECRQHQVARDLHRRTGSQTQLLQRLQPRQTAKHDHVVERLQPRVARPVRIELPGHAGDPDPEDLERGLVLSRPLLLTGGFFKVNKLFRLDIGRHLPGRRIADHDQLLEVRAQLQEVDYFGTAHGFARSRSRPRSNSAVPGRPWPGVPGL